MTQLIRVYKCTKLWVTNTFSIFFKDSVSPCPPNSLISRKHNGLPSMAKPKQGRGAKTDLRTSEYPNNFVNIKRQKSMHFYNIKGNKSIYLNTS